MNTEQASTNVPVPVGSNDSEGHPRVCPKCGHTRGEPHGQQWIVRVFRMKPFPAMCRESDAGPSGWPEMCGCTDQFHGS